MKNAAPAAALAGRPALQAFFIILLGLAAPARPAERFTFEEPHMGTLVRLVLAGPDRDAAAAAARAAFDRIAELDAALSDYRETSEISGLARAAGGPAVPVGPDLLRVLVGAEDVWRRSEGAFDVTVGPIVRLWRRTLKGGDWPSAERLAEALRLVGSDKMRLDPGARTVRLERAGMRIDLGGIAKGYAGDEALRTLRSHGWAAALVAVGGDVVAGEAPPGEEGWIVDAAPVEGISTADRLLLKNAAVSTSGDREQWTAKDGVRYSHILDPRTGIGLAGRRQTTVVAEDGMTADAVATAVCVLGGARGIALVEATAGASALVFQEGEGLRASRTWPRLPRPR